VLGRTLTPDATLEELRAHLNIRVSTLAAYLRRLGLSFKQK
jgi:hypothetical protein